MLSFSHSGGPGGIDDFFLISSASMSRDWASTRMARVPMAPLTLSRRMSSSNCATACSKVPIALSYVIVVLLRWYSKRTLIFWQSMVEYGTVLWFEF